MVTRNCTYTGWVPEAAPECNYKQNVRSVYDNFAKFDGYDLFIIGENAAVYRSKKKEWSRDCFKFGFTKDILDYNKYFTMYPDYFWLPIRRYKPFFPHVWSNLGEKFGQVTEDYMEHGSEDCLAVNFSSNHIKSLSCTEKFLELCLYVYESPLLPLSCPKGQHTTRFQSKDSKCYQVSTSGECETLFRYNEPYDRILYRALMDEFKSDGDCRIEIDPFQPNMTFTMDYWMANLDQVNYVNWSPEVNRQTNSLLQTYTYADKEGDWLLGINYKCAVCERGLIPREPSLQLVYNYEEERLELLVTNPEFLWKEDQDDPHIACFTTGTDALLANVDVLDHLFSIQYRHELSGHLVNVFIFEVDLDGDGPGEYWCEAVAHPSFEVISSNHQVVYSVRKGTVFAITAVHQCKSKCMGIYKEDVLKYISSEFKDFLEFLNVDVDIEDVRVMDVLNSSSSRETLLFHVTFSTDNLPDELEDINFEPNVDKEFLISINLINYVTQKLSAHVNAYQWDAEFSILGFNHTMFCVSEMAVNGGQKLVWGRMNEIKVIPGLCLDENYILTTALCVGDFPHGVIWNGEISKDCENNQQPPPLTQKLFEMLSSRTITVDEVNILDNSLQEEHYDINPADMFLLGSLVGRFVNNVSDLIRDPNGVMVFTRLFSQSLAITVDRAQISHRHMNATNVMLNNFERLLQRSSIELNPFITEKERDNGVVEFINDNVVSFIIDPSVRNITGIAFYLRKTEEEFNSGRVEYLYSTQDEMELLEDAELEGAAFLPHDLLEEIRVNFTGPLRIVMTIIENDVLFRTRNNVSDYSPVGRVLTASIPNYDRPLPALFPIIFRPRRNLIQEDSFQCGFWNFHPRNQSRISEWSNFGCDFLAKSSRSDDPAFMCGCQHFTNFAFLVTGNNNNNKGPPGTETVPPHVEKIMISLDVITQIGCVMSLIGVFLIWITAIVFRSWREKAGPKILLQLSFGIGLQVFMLLLINFDHQFYTTTTSCITIGIILHYSVLVIFSWMLITAYLQYLRYVVVFGNLLPKHFFLKATVCGWILPLVPIMIICIIDPGLYIPEHNGSLDGLLCYPQGNALYLGVVLPVALIIFTNLCIFVMIIYNITIGLQKCNNHRKQPNNIHRAQLRLTIVLFFLLGLTWIFGLLVHLELDTYIFTYLFTILGTLQGFVMFVYFIILDPQTRKLWLSRFSCCYKKEFNSSTYNS